jgi:transposase
VDWLPANHLVFFLLDLATELDLEAIHAVYRQKDPRDEMAYEPRMMVVLLLYAYCVGSPSSRKIEKACWEDAAFRVLTGSQQPDHSRISDFRRQHLAALAGLIVQVLRLCQKAGLVSLGQVALDGTKVKANASKHKAMSHARMLKSERQLDAEMRALLRKAEIIDAQEDGQYGKATGAMSCLRNCSGVPAGWSGSARPRLNWKQKLLQPRPLNGTNRPRRLSRRQKQPRPVAMNSAARVRHAAAVVRASGPMTPRRS